MRTKPHSKPIVILGLVRDLQAKDNIAFDAEAKHDTAWDAWFRWEKEKPDVKAPTPLTAAEVGPDAP